MVIQGVFASGAADVPLVQTPPSPLPFGEVMSNVASISNQRTRAASALAKVIQAAPSQLENAAGVVRSSADNISLWEGSAALDDSRSPPYAMVGAAMQQAFTFSQLGIFGLSGATPTDPGTAVGNAVLSSPAAPVAESEPDSTAAILPASPSLFFGTSQATEQRIIAVAAPSPIAIATQAADGGAEEMTEAAEEARPMTSFGRPEIEEAAGLPASASTAPGAGLSAASEATNAPVSVAVSQQAGALQIVAASPQMSADARVKLYQAVASLADEFGLSVAELMHNGVQISSVLIGAEGAKGL